MAFIRRFVAAVEVVCPSQMDMLRVISSYTVKKLAFGWSPTIGFSTGAHERRKPFMKIRSEDILN